MYNLLHHTLSECCAVRCGAVCCGVAYEPHPNTHMLHTVRQTRLSKLDLPYTLRPEYRFREKQMCLLKKQKKIRI